MNTKFGLICVIFLCYLCFASAHYYYEDDNYDILREAIHHNIETIKNQNQKTVETKTIQNTNNDIMAHEWSRFSDLS
jgi:hypothetical protein